MTRVIAILAVLAVCAGVLAETPPEPPPVTASGDVIYFKAGGVLSGVQVLRETLDNYEVEVQEGVDPIIIPRAHVERIDYDDIDPLRMRRRRRPGHRDPEHGVVQGQEVDPELFESLTASLPNEPISYRDTDFLEILTDLGERFDVAFEFAEAARQIPEERRRISFETEPGAALVSAVRMLLMRHFPAFEMTYRYDVVRIAPRDERDDAAPAPPAPPDTPESPPSPALPENETAGPEPGGETML